MRRGRGVKDLVKDWKDLKLDHLTTSSYIWESENQAVKGRRVSINMKGRRSANWSAAAKNGGRKPSYDIFMPGVDLAATLSDYNDACLTHRDVGRSGDAER